MLRTVQATRYVAPLREGGSLPGLVEADDLGMYVVKFTGAGQGRKALVAEVVAGQLARALGLPVPDLVVVELDPVLGRAEPDPEIQDLLRASPGANLGMDYLPGSITYDPLAHPVDPQLAARIIWFDALTLNVDRTWRNPNLLLWGRRLWLIDHGAALFPQHSWTADRPPTQPDRPLPGLADHVLLPGLGSDAAAALTEADRTLAARVTEAVLSGVVAEVPAGWLELPAGTYVEFLLARLAGDRPWARL